MDRHEEEEMMSLAERHAILRVSFMTLLVNMKTARDQLSIETGTCCCGSPMEGHSVYDNHSPRDEGEYFITSAIESAEKALEADTKVCT